MAEDTKPKAGGGKLARSEVTTVRLDPKLKYLAELAARKQRRTLSSYIEWAIESSLRDVYLEESTNFTEAVSVADEAVRLWDIDDSERFIRLAITYPELLTHEEQERWKMVMDSDLLGPAKQRRNDGVIAWNRPILEDKVYPAVRRYWPDVIRAHGGGADESRKWVAQFRAAVQSGNIYPGYPPKPRASLRDLSDDVPF